MGYLSDYLDMLPGGGGGARVARAAAGAEGTSSQVIEPGSPGETDQGSNPQNADLSMAGRAALHADLTAPMGQASVGRTALGLMGMLAGPIGSILGRAAAAAIQFDNKARYDEMVDAQNAEGEAGGNPGQDPSGVATGLSDAAAGNPGIGSDDPGVGTGVGNTGVGIGDAPGVTGDAGTAGQGAPAGSSGPGGAPSGAPGDAGDSDGGYRRGGVVKDRQQRPGGAEAIQAHQGEYVVKAAAVKHYGQTLLDAINRGEAEVKVSRKSLKDSLTRR